MYFKFNVGSKPKKVSAENLTVMSQMTTIWQWLAKSDVPRNQLRLNWERKLKECRKKLRRIFCSQSLVLGIFQVEFTWRHLPSVNCINYGFFLEPLQNTVLPKTSSKQVTGLWSRGPLKFLNDTKLILNDQGSHSLIQNISLLCTIFPHMGPSLE